MNELETAAVMAAQQAVRVDVDLHYLTALRTVEKAARAFLQVRLVGSDDQVQAAREQLGHALERVPR